VSDPAFSWAQLGADLVVTVVGSFLAIWGALWVANRTFQRDIETIRKRALFLLLAEFAQNDLAITQMLENPQDMFPLERYALDKALPDIEIVPAQVGVMIQRVAMLIARYNATDPPNLDALRDVRTPLRCAGHLIARHQKGSAFLRLITCQFQK